jgi:hypothetical protein
LFFLQSFNLENGETQSTSGDTDNVVVDSSNNEFVGVTVLCAIIGNGYLSSNRLNAYVSKFAVVGRSHRVKTEEVKRVRVHVISLVSRNRRSVIPRVDKREVVSTHGSETVGVFVYKTGLLDRI